MVPSIYQNPRRELPGRQKILSIVNFLNKDIRYTGIEFSEASLVPRKPSEVLAHRYGDCKDKSTLAVALLRAAGIDASVALLDSSTGQDIEPDMPGIGAFNHAIVYVPGPPDLWLDPTDDDLRLGVVSPSNQGRYALIARPETTALIRTPELKAEENRVVEKREFELSELGRAKVTETSEVFGTPDRNFRGMFGDKDAKALRDTFKDYIEWTYAEAKVRSITTSDVTDLAKPYQLKIELDDAQRGTTARSEAAVAIRISQITTRLPDFFSTDPKSKMRDESKPEPQPRTSDFSISEPFTYQWHYIIHAPPGFRVRRLPEALDEHLGPATLVAHFTSPNATSALADFKFVMPERRFSAAEGLALRDAVLELAKRKMIVVYFDQIGETDLAAGKVREALAEFSALRKLHPNEALHAMQTARALLAAGAGNTARDEARRAVTLAPKDPQTYVQLAEILKNDLIGRPMEKGFDLDGAAAAYRKALELDPNDAENRGNLAILLEFNPSGIRYGTGAKMDEAVAEYAKILDKLPDIGLTNNYPIALLYAGRAADLKAYMQKALDDQNNKVLRICAEALLNGSEAALQQVSQISANGKPQVLASVAQTLLAIRQYRLAADILSGAASVAANPTATSNLINLLRKTRPHEEVGRTIHEPEDAIRSFIARVSFYDPQSKDLFELFSSYVSQDADDLDVKTLAQAMGTAKAKIRGSGLTLETAVDVGLGAIQFSREGSDDTGWLVRMAIPGAGTPAGQQQVWYVIREGPTYRILAANGEFAGIARLLIDLLDNGKLEQARVWLDRVRRELPAGSGDDPLSGPMFSRVWHVGGEASPQDMRRAAAVLLCNKKNESKRVIPILEEAIKAASAGTPDAVSASLADAYFTDKQYDRSLAISEELLRKLPKSESALRLTLRSAYAQGGGREASRIAASYLEGFKDDPAALRGAAVVAMVFGDVERTISIEKQIVDSGRGQSSDYNQIAWAAVMAGKVSPETLEIANHGMMLGTNESTGLMHTIAAVDAELDKPAEARAMLLQRITASGLDEPDDDDWYVFGRIAECYGLTRDATAMYRRLERPKNEWAIPASSYALAQKRLKALENTTQVQ